MFKFNLQEDEDNQEFRVLAMESLGETRERKRVVGLVSSIHQGHETKSSTSRPARPRRTLNKGRDLASPYPNPRQRRKNHLTDVSTHHVAATQQSYNDVQSRRIQLANERLEFEKVRHEDIMKREKRRLDLDRRMLQLRQREVELMELGARRGVSSSFNLIFDDLLSD